MLVIYRYITIRRIFERYRIKAYNKKNSRPVYREFIIEFV